MLSSSMLPMQFMQHFHQEHLHQVPGAFSFNQGLTSAAASTDVKEVFKSISNKHIASYSDVVQLQAILFLLLSIVFNDDVLLIFFLHFF